MTNGLSTLTVGEDNQVLRRERDNIPTRSRMAGSFQARGFLATEDRIVRHRRHPRDFIPRLSR
jgi:hypothetical protein